MSCSLGPKPPPTYTNKIALFKCMGEKKIDQKSMKNPLRDIMILYYWHATLFPSTWSLYKMCIVSF